MRSRTPKVLHQLCGRPMLAYVLDAWDEARATLDGVAGDVRRPDRAPDPVVVYSPATDAVRDVVGDAAKFALQDEPRGTGDAVRAALAVLPDGVAELVVLSGDVPLVIGPAARRGVERRRLDDAAIALASVFAADAGRARSGRAQRVRLGERIVEARDATPDELETNEINAGMYAFDVAWLRRRIGSLTPSASNGELYLTDLVRLAREDGRS